MRVAQALMGSLAQHEHPQVGWTCRTKEALQNDLRMPDWYSIELCTAETRKACEKKGFCDDKDWDKDAAGYLARCRKVEFRQVRTVTEI